jgi:hypothetical protein
LVSNLRCCGWMLWEFVYLLLWMDVVLLWEFLSLLLWSWANTSKSSFISIQLVVDLCVLGATLCKSSSSIRSRLDSSSVRKIFIFYWWNKVSVQLTQWPPCLRPEAAGIYFSFLGMEKVKCNKQRTLEWQICSREVNLIKFACLQEVEISYFVEEGSHSVCCFWKIQCSNF